MVHSTSHTKRFLSSLPGPILRTLSSLKRELLFRYRILSRRPAPCVYLFGVPYHPNMGDWAQTYCITRWCRVHLPQHTLACTSINEPWRARLCFIRRHFRKGDILLMHSGYHLTDLYSEREVYEEIAQMFPERIIRILPQTVFFKDPAQAQACGDIFNQHGKCILLCRDEQSFQTAQSLFSKCRTRLIPDIVTSLIGTYTPPQTERRGVYFCMRHDKEALHSADAIRQLIQQTSQRHPTDLGDTTINAPLKEIRNHLETVLMKEIGRFARYEVTVTDRYHGTIFSLIAGTPVIVLNSSDHKLSSGVKWFPESFSQHVFFANTLQEVPPLIEQIIESGAKPSLPPYFQEHYFGEHLKRTLELDD